MYSLGSRFACPKCQSPTSIKHCHSPSCMWFTCYKCQDLNKAVVFNAGKQFFIWSK